MGRKGWYGLVLNLCLGLSVLAQDKVKEEKVLFYTVDSSIRIGATISYPVHEKDLTALVLVSGTGQQDRDGTMGGQKLFARLADYLSSEGFAVLRMDDRGVAETTGDYAKATTADFAHDALSALHYLKGRTDLGIARIGMLGHSEGGAAMAIAAMESDDVAFLVSLAGLASNGLDALLQQNEDLVNHSPLDPRDKIRSNEINSLMFATAYQYADSANLEQKLNERYEEWKKRDDAYIKSLGIEFDHFRFPIWSYVQQATSPWYRYFVRYNAQMVLSHVKVPVLAINGDKDLMVSDKNLVNWKAYTALGGNEKVTIKLLPQVNHLLQSCQTCDIKEYTNLGPIDNSIMALIAQWLKETIGK